jgi:hypothetical protein
MKYIVICGFVLAVIFAVCSLVKNWFEETMETPDPFDDEFWEGDDPGRDRAAGLLER